MAKEEMKTLFMAAWAAHARGNDIEAEKLFCQSLELDPDSIDALYGLAIVMKAMGQNRDAIHLFEEIIRRVESREWEDRDRARMLRRLALGQVSYLRDQDWNLEREVWRQ